MKGRYSGRHMTIYGTILPGAISIARSALLTDKLTERAKYKIKVLDWHRKYGNNVSLTSRHFGLGRITGKHNLIFQNEIWIFPFQKRKNIYAIDYNFPSSWRI